MRQPDRLGTRITPPWIDAADQKTARQLAEARETAEALIEDRGATNARAWVEHCMTRDQSGFWRRVLEAL